MDTLADKCNRMGPSRVVHRLFYPLNTIGKQYTKFDGCCSNLKYQTGSKMIVPLMMMEIYPSKIDGNTSFQQLNQ